MKKGWEYKELGELCHKFNGLWKGKKAPFVRVGVIRNANFTKAFTLDFSNIEYLDVEEKQYASRKLQLGDLIVEKSGGSEKQPVGRAVLFQEKEGEYSFSNFTSVLRVKDNHEITPEFLYKYILHVYLRGDTRKMQKATTGIHNIEFDKYLAINIPIPPLSEQKEIVEYLDSSFAKIDKLKENAAKNLEEAKALFQSALKNALEPKEGWEYCEFSKVVDSLRTGLNPRVHFKLNTEDAQGYYVTVRELKGFTFEIDSKTDRINDAAIKRINERSNLQIGDVLFSGTGTIGRTALVEEEPTWWNIKEGVYAITPNKNRLESKFLIYLFKSDLILNKIYSKASGATIRSIPMKELNKIVLPIPPLSEQQSIVSFLDSLNEKVNTLQQNYSRICSECDALKQAILRQVFE